MASALLLVCAIYFLFGATIYVGIMWSLHYFFYPSWSSLRVDNVHDHFIVPTSAATRFFLVVVPLMFLTGLVLLIAEWGEGAPFIALVVAYLGIAVSTYVGWLHIIPVNRTIRDGVADDAALQVLLKRWMVLNNIRWVTVTIMWAAIVWYFVAVGDVIDHIGG